MKRASWMLFGIGALALLAETATAQDAKLMPAPAAPDMTSPVVIGCCDTGCSTSTCCNAGCCGTDSHRAGGGLIFDIGFMILTPKWNNNPAFFIDGPVNGDGPGTPNKEASFDFSEQFVPKISLGYASENGFGGRIGWWGFASSRTQSAFVDPGSGLTLSATMPLNVGNAAEGQFDAFRFPANLNGRESGSAGDGGTIVAGAKLRMDVWDFELIDLVQLERWSILFSGGIRYAHVSQGYNVVTALADGDSAAFLTSGQNFNGAGPTLAIDARRYLGNTGLYAYGTTRGSLLFGESKQDAYAGGFNTNDFSQPVLDGESHSDCDTTIGVVEAEIGVGYSTRGRRVDAFFQVGLVGQLWIGAGNSSRSNYDFNGQDDSGSGVQDGNLGLVGFSMKAGITY